ncbi:hypothetical protein QWY75_10025 [Pontixanthobacter aestiaquae]|uniref:Uncharacterized protein n=1 Tax=Pontixanthobacter aestiaquae TaxID=1509367 RepID=A0A844Z427_9SPHN|nr:hypothetical protein [Pontixanthobacter aestiaquae]MDN3646534.1 hypothetical protein [Pontixanthobacter aestiaquae]MXO82478.1 hypothetical protein [Pontixanthobacter aestiaquae]
MELQGVANDLLATFISRYNQIDGYWALGKFQSFLSDGAHGSIIIDLIATDRITSAYEKFPETNRYYSGAMVRIAESKGIPVDWIVAGSIEVRSLSKYELHCRAQLTADNGRKFASEALVQANKHSPAEFRSASDITGPSNQRGQ